LVINVDSVTVPFTVTDRGQLVPIDMNLTSGQLVADHHELAWKTICR
jgi:hypothetical protein